MPKLPWKIKMIEIPNSEIDIETSKSGGPGGQHVNKTSSRVTLRWHLKQSTALSEDQKERCLLRLKNRINLEGELVLHVDTFRSQIMNREYAYERLHELVEQALVVLKKRVKTKASKASKARRLEAKKRRGQKKKRRRVDFES